MHKFTNMIVIAFIFFVSFNYASESAPSKTDTCQAPQVDKIEVYKSKRLMRLLSKGKVIKSYKIALGGNPAGHKQFQGDQKTPEGCYTIDYRNHKSRFHKSLHISYPNQHDCNHAKKNGKSAGGDVFIHGLGAFGLVGKLHTLKDWTLGCVAVTNQEIDEIWDLVPNSTKIEIYP